MIPFQALSETATSRKARVRKYNHGENWGETLAFVFANVPIKLDSLENASVGE